MSHCEHGNALVFNGQPMRPACGCVLKNSITGEPIVSWGDRIAKLERDVAELRGTVRWLEGIEVATRGHRADMARRERESGGSLPEVDTDVAAFSRDYAAARAVDPPVLDKSGGKCGAVFQVDGGPPTYTCALERGHEGRHTS